MAKFIGLPSKTSHALSWTFATGYQDPRDPTDRRDYRTPPDRLQAQNYNAKLCELQLAEYLNNEFGAEYGVDLNIYAKGARHKCWDADLPRCIGASGGFPPIEVKSHESRFTPISWIFQYPEFALRFPNWEERGRVDPKYKKAHSKFFLLALTTIDTQFRVTLNFLFPGLEARTLFQPPKLSKPDKSALYNKTLLEAGLNIDFGLLNVNG